MNIKSSTKEDDIIMDHCYLFFILAQCIWIASCYPFIRSILPFLITPSNSQRPWIASSFRIGIPCCCNTKRLYCCCQLDELRTMIHIATKMSNQLKLAIAGSMFGSRFELREAPQVPLDPPSSSGEATALPCHRHLTVPSITAAARNST